MHQDLFKFTQKHYKYILLLLILILAAAMRFYRIREYITFLGDEGRDVLVVKRMLIDHKLTLLGPITSVGSIYMGPIYYYFMAPFLLLWQFDPVGPAVMVAIFSLSTVFLIYKLSADFLKPSIGLIAGFLYAISPLTIVYGRSSWNPNIVPFFSILLVYSMLQVFEEKRYKFLPVAGLSLGVLLQLHYVTFMFFLIIPVIYLVYRMRIPWKKLIWAPTGFIVSYSPFILFEIRHGFINSQGALRFFFQQKSELVKGVIAFSDTIMDVFVRLFWRLVVIQNAEITKFLLLLIILLFFFNAQYLKKELNGIKILSIWFIVGIISYGLYRGVIYDYYFGSLFVLPFLFTAIFLYLLWQKSIYTKILSILIFFILVFFNTIHSPLRIEPNNMLSHTQRIAEFIFDKTEGKPYNFALIAGKNSDHAYRYFLELWQRPPTVIENPDIDPTRNSVTDQLWVICEEKVCQPLGHPLWEIAGFGRAEIRGEWQVDTARVIYLTHFQEEKE